MAPTAQQMRAAEMAMERQTSGRIAGVLPPEGEGGGSRGGGGAGGAAVEELRGIRAALERQTSAIEKNTAAVKRVATRTVCGLLLAGAMVVVGVAVIVARGDSGAMAVGAAVMIALLLLVVAVVMAVLGMLSA